MYSATLKDFLLSGRLGPLEFGLSPAQVESLCGPPDDVSTPYLPRIWKFGDLQVSFSRDDPSPPEELLHFLGLYMRFVVGRTITTFSALGLSGWWPDSATTLEEFKDYLDLHHIPWSIHPMLTFEEQTTLTVGIGVSACFSHEDSGIVLDSLQWMNLPWRI